jgi:hypothetical protein
VPRLPFLSAFELAVDAMGFSGHSFKLSSLLL